MCTIESRGSHISREQVSLFPFLVLPLPLFPSRFFSISLFPIHRLIFPFLSPCIPLPTRCPLPFLSFVLGSFVNRLFVIAFGPTNELTRSSIISLLVSPSFTISLFLLLICRDVLACSLLVAFDWPFTRLAITSWSNHPLFQLIVCLRLSTSVCEKSRCTYGIKYIRPSYRATFQFLMINSLKIRKKKMIRLNVIFFFLG